MQSVVQNQMENIANLDIEPKVFRINLRFMDSLDGFSCDVDFRSNDRGLYNTVTHGDTPEHAVNSMFNYLREKFSACQHCGRKGPRELE